MSLARLFVLRCALFVTPFIFSAALVTSFCASSIHCWRLMKISFRIYNLRRMHCSSLICIKIVGKVDRTDYFGSRAATTCACILIFNCQIECTANLIHYLVRRGFIDNFCWSEKWQHFVSILHNVNAVKGAKLTVVFTEFHHVTDSTLEDSFCVHSFLIDL